MHNSKAIWVNGANGELGEAGVRELANAGFKVFAGVRSEAKAERIGALSENIHPVVFDVTDQASIERCVADIKNELGEDSLYGIWTNAGISKVIPFGLMEWHEIEQIIDVNLYGTFRIIGAGLPLLEKGNSRVVITGSATGMLAGPGVSIYSATKWGLEGFCDALRIELNSMGTHLSLIQPGLIKSNMSDVVEHDVATRLGSLSQEQQAENEVFFRTIEKAAATAKPIAGEVGEAVLRAFTDRNPKARYRVGTDAKAVRFIRHLPDRALDALQRKIFGVRNAAKR